MTKSTPIRECVNAELQRYFELLEDQKPGELYKMVIGEAEQALFEVIMRITKGNRSRAAEYLGISRGTLQKKIKHYGIES